MNYNYENEWRNKKVPEEIINFLKVFSKNFNAKLEPFKNIRDVSHNKVIFAAKCSHYFYTFRNFSLVLKLIKNHKTNKYEGELLYAKPIKSEKEKKECGKILIFFDDKLNITRVDGNQDITNGKIFFSAIKDNDNIKFNKFNFYDKKALEVSKTPKDETLFKSYNILPDFTLNDLNDEARNIMENIEKSLNFYEFLINIAAGTDYYPFNPYSLNNIENWQNNYEYLKERREKEKIEREMDYKRKKENAFRIAEYRWKEKKFLYKLLHKKYKRTETDNMSLEEINSLYIDYVYIKK